MQMFIFAAFCITTLIALTNASVPTTLAPINSTNTTSFWDDCDLDWKVDFEGKSGKFKLYPCKDDGIFIKVHMKGIQEYAYNKKGKLKKSKNKAASLSYKNTKSTSHGSGYSSIYQWTDSNGSQVNLTGVTLDYQFEVDDQIVIFESTLYLIDQTIQITWDNYTQTLAKGSLKWDYYIVNWPFEEDDSLLEIVVKMSTGGTKSNQKVSIVKIFSVCDIFGTIL